ncbi:no significant blast hit, weak hit to transposase [Histoplasma capsulatum G186AR]|nr:no significant blast hit, weak hit to transposase [Histoplasma capsulatum G186AR]
MFHGLLARGEMSLKDSCPLLPPFFFFFFAGETYRSIICIILRLSPSSSLVTFAPFSWLFLAIFAGCTLVAI